MANARARYIPVLNRQWLTPAHDWVLSHVFREDRFKEALVAEATLSPAGNVCSTSGAGLARSRSPRHAGTVVGLDGDPEVRARAVAKAAAGARHLPRFVEGLSYALPCADRSFDRVTSCLMLHHLTGPDKQRTLREALRVLAPGGWLHIADFGPPGGWFARAVSHLTLHLEETRENLRGEIPGMLQSAGFDEIRLGRTFETILGTVRLHHARAPVDVTA